jgi:hypothetical protein
VTDDGQLDILSPLTDLDLSRFLIADLHNDLNGMVSRYRQLVDLSSSLGSAGTLLAGGETSWTHWTEARSSFVHGNYAATVFLAQGLAEHLLADHLRIGLMGEELPERISFQETLSRCRTRDIISEADETDLRRLMGLRNPLSHFRSIDDPANLTRRVLNTMLSAEENLRRDATFAISMAVRLLALPAFRLDG